MECKNALEYMKKGKSPGVDGLTIEFYKAFWDKTSKLILNSLNEAYKREELTITQNRGINLLLPKPKSKEELNKRNENWRLSTLLNVDYEIGSKALALRLEKVLPSVIHSNQAGLVKRRFIGECIRTIDNAIYFTDYKQCPGLALFLDFKKAFESIEHNFITKALQTFNF